MEPVRFGRARFFKNLREANKDLSRVVSTICFELYFTSTFMPSPFGLDGILFSKLPLSGWRPSDCANFLSASLYESIFARNSSICFSGRPLSC